MNDYVIEVNDETFEAAIASGVVLVDFWAPWCGPCRMQAPILDDVGQQLGARAKVLKVNVDEAIQTAARFGIRSIPTLAIFKDGQPIGAFTGLQHANTLTDAVERVISGELKSQTAEEQP